MLPDIVIPALLIVQGLLGGIDTAVNHEYLERLPQRLEARNEVGLHAARDTIYAMLFAGLAWFEWHGVFAVFIGALLLGEVAVTACDEFIENRIRVLPQNERVMHVFLILNFGFVIAALVPTLIAWVSLPPAVVRTDHGTLSLALSVLALIAIAWAIRDALAWRRLGALREALS